MVSAHHSIALSVLNGLMPSKNSYRMQPRLNQSTHSLYGTRLPAEFRRRISGAQSAYERLEVHVWEKTLLRVEVENVSEQVASRVPNLHMSG